MKKKITLAVFVSLIGMGITTNMSCSPGSSNKNNPVSILPDVANFEIKAATTFVKDAASTISILSSSLGDGTFTIHYDLSGANILSGLTATMTMSGGNGTFQTPTLPNYGQTNINITSVSNSSGGSSDITSNNTYAFSDSEGLMTATYTSGGVATSFRATHVIALATGSQLTITGVVWTPKLTTIDLTDYLYASGTQTVNFNSNNLDFMSISNNSTYNGLASYQVSASSGLINDASEHGQIKITAVSPLLTGTFSYTNQDSSTVVGSFSCPHP